MDDLIWGQVSDIYQQELGRAPDEGGHQNFYNALANGWMSIDDVRNAMRGSPEYAQRNAAPVYQEPAYQAPDYSGTVNSLYQEVLGRGADPGGMSGWSNYLAQGHSADELRNMLMSSEEYYNRIAAQNQPVYQEPVYQPPAYQEPVYQEPAYQPPAYQEPVYQPPAVPDYSGTINDLYQEILGRGADPWALSNLPNYLFQGNSVNDLRNLLISSEEYQNRVAAQQAAQNQPVYQAPAAPAYVAPEPVYQAPAYQEPVYQAPAYQEPAAPVYQEPAYQAPDYSGAVNALYQEILGRGADQGGLDSSINYLAQGNSIDSLRQMMLGSAEYQSRLAAQTPAAPVYEAPAAPTHYDVQVDPNTGQGTLVDQNGGTILALQPVMNDQGQTVWRNPDTYETVDVDQLNKNAAGYTDETTKLYQDILGRAPTAEEISNINNAINNGTMSGFDQIQQAVIGSPEYTNKALPFLNPNDDVAGKFQSGAVYFTNKGLTPAGDYEGVPTKYYNADGSLAAWFGNLGTKDNRTNDTNSYTWHTPAELSISPDAVPVVAHPRPEDAQLKEGLIGAGTVLAGIFAPEVIGYLAAGAGAGAGLTAAEAAALMGVEVGAPSLTAGITPGMIAASEAALPGIGSSSLLANAAQAGGLNALATAIKGGSPEDILKSAGIGALSSGIGGALSGYLDMGTIGNITAKAATSAAIAAASGGDPAQAALTSAMSSAISSAIPSITTDALKDLPESVQKAANSAVSSAIASAVKGGDVSTAAIMGAVNSGLISLGDAVYNSDAVKELRASLSSALDGIKSNLTNSIKETKQTEDSGDKLLQEILGRPDTGENGSAGKDNDSSLDTGYRGDALPVSPPVNTNPTPLPAGPLDKETQAEVDAAAAKPIYSDSLNAKFSNANSLLNLVPDTAALIVGVAARTGAELENAINSLISSTDYNRLTNEQVKSIYEAAQSAVNPVRNLILDAAQIGADSPEAKSGLLTKTLDGIGEAMHSVAVPIAEALNIPVQDVEAFLALAGPKIIGKTFGGIANAAGDMSASSWAAALDRVTSKVSDAGLIVDPKFKFMGEGNALLKPAETFLADSKLKQFDAGNLAKNDPVFTIAETYKVEPRTAAKMADNAAKIGFTVGEALSLGLINSSGNLTPVGDTVLNNDFDLGAAQPKPDPLPDLEPEQKPEPVAPPETKPANDPVNPTPNAPTIEPAKPGNPANDPVINPAPEPDKKPLPVYIPPVQPEQPVVPEIPVAPVVDPVREPTKEPVKEPAKEPVRDPLGNPIQEPARDPFEDPDINPTLDPVRDPVQDPAIDPVRDPVQDPAIDPVRDPVQDPFKDLFKDPVKAGETAPKTDPVPKQDIVPQPPVAPTPVAPQPKFDIDPIDGQPVDITPIEGDPTTPENIAKAAAQSKFKFNMSLSGALQPAGSNQNVSVTTPPAADIDYLYDIGGESIFAPMKREDKYLPRTNYYDPQIEKQYAYGGDVDLYELLRSK